MSLTAKEKCKRCRLKKKLIEEGTMLRKLKIKNRGQFCKIKLSAISDFVFLIFLRCGATKGLELATMG